jgi:uncharacterized membrane protein SirB2
MNAYTIFKYAHSGLRYIVVILLLLAIIQSLAGWFGKKAYTEGNRKVNLFAMISAHTQLLFGLVLYFLSPFVQFSANTMKDATTRYWTVEHITMMIAALVFITIGHAKSKRANTPEAKHKTIAIFYILAVLIIVVALSAGHVPLFGMSA